MSSIESVEQKIALTELQARVIEMLQNGKENAVLRTELCKRLQESERKVRLTIESLRHEGWQIVTSGQGYYICKSEDELNEFVRYMRSRIREECIMLAQVRKATKRKIERQVQLPMLIGGK